MVSKAFLGLLPLISRLNPLLPAARAEGERLITPDLDSFIESVIQQWDLSGLAIGLVRRDATSLTGWYQEFASYGAAKADGTLVTPDTVFAIGSNSKLFAALATGLLISNETLKRERGVELSWSTKAKKVYGDLWGLWDEEASNGTSLQDMLSHRTGLPGHDFSNVKRNDSLVNKIATLRFLRPSAEFRETWQYNNLMYDSLAYLPQLSVNQSFSSYVEQHILQPLGIGRGLQSGFDGVKKPIVPLFVKPGNDYDLAGSAGVLSSARDLTVWVATLLTMGNHPFRNQTVIPSEVVQRAATGVSVVPDDIFGTFPEISTTAYGAGQFIYSYRGHSIVEHAGDVPGFDSWVSRLPNDNLGIVLLCNELALNALNAIKWRLIDEIVIRSALPDAPLIDWVKRYQALENSDDDKVTPRPKHPIPPSLPLTYLQQRKYSHPAYGTLQPCLVPSSLLPGPSATHVANIDPCRATLDSLSVRHILNMTDLSVPTLIVPLDGVWTTHLRLSHFSGNLFNTTVIWANAQARLDAGLGSVDNGVWEDDGDVVITASPANVLIEWVIDGEEGSALKGNAWAMGPDASEPVGSGRESAEVWFSRIA
ncbi:Protein flp [Leucoagaricus sp. SymC.cos]|nr:Protein flp [Leucoagaricus sp. SymC.cos]